MHNIRVVTDPAECRRVWERAIPPETIYDLWEVRDCFHRQFNRPLYFIVAENGDRITGLLPMAWIEESQCYGYFPGETWQGETWLEQNRFPVDDKKLLDEMLLRVNGYGSAINLRYLLSSEIIIRDNPRIDELDYVFNPPEAEYSLENFLRRFSHKSAKRIQRDIKYFESRGLGHRYNNIDDFDLMVRFNLQRYGELSYFSDRRFTDAFRELTVLLNAKGWLRITTVIIGDIPAAIDLGSVYNGVYTLLAGGTNPDFSGIAKVINLHHIKWACEQRMQQVDFLCGDFSWKPLFHLTPRPLYLFSNIVSEAQSPIERQVQAAKQLQTEKKEVTTNA